MWIYEITFQQAAKIKRGARQTHKRLSYTFKINRTSLDHLLLGKCADIDKMSNAPSILRSFFQSSQMSRPSQDQVERRFCGQFFALAIGGAASTSVLEFMETVSRRKDL